MQPSSAENRPYDYVLAGGGLAGLCLAWKLVHGSNPDARILILDKEPKRKNDRTWCYWSRAEGEYDSLAAHAWTEMIFSHPDATLRIALKPYRYRMIRGIDFYRRITAELEKCSGVEFQFGEIQSIRDGREFAEGILDGKRFQGRWVFDSLFRPADLVRNTKRYTYLLQHFLGWEIETAQDTFDPEAFTMFDFRTPQRGAMRFFYILPTSKRRAMVEYTVFSPQLLEEAQYKEALEAYLRGVLEVDRYEIVGTEFGVIPMTDRPFRRRLGRRILAIGTRGGRVKPSTGFAFRRIQSDSNRILQSLERYGDPFHLTADPLRHRLYDSSMLRIMRGSPEQMAGILLRLFQRNPVERVFQFLDEEIGWMDNLRLFATMPVGVFLPAFLGFHTETRAKTPPIRTGR